MSRLPTLEQKVRTNKNKKKKHKKIKNKNDNVGAAAHFENIVASQNNDVAEKDKAYREEIKKKNAEKAVSKANFKDKMSNFQ